LNVATGYLGQFSVGEIPQKITANYKGDLHRRLRGTRRGGRRFGQDVEQRLYHSGRGRL
jgi:hypothetical protein